MSKAKAPVRRPIATPPDAAVDLPARWQGRPWRPLVISAVVLAAVLASGLAFSDALTSPRPSALASCVTSTQTGPHTFIGPQPICIVPGRTYQATVNTTKGPITLQLYPTAAPVTVNNFIVLALDGYYNGMPFTTQSWVVQNGDPTGDGRGGPGYNLPSEPKYEPPTGGLAPWAWRGRSTARSTAASSSSSWPRGRGPGRPPSTTGSER